MKKTMIAIAVLVCLLVAGCTAQPAAETAALQDQVDQLQRELEALQADDAVPPEPEADSADEAQMQPPADTEANAAGTPHTKTTDSYDLATMETAVDGVEAQIAAVALTGDAQTDRAAFRELHNTLESVGRQVDRLDDAIEADARGGALSPDDYRLLDARVDALDDRIDRAEDQLEFAFGMDD